LTIGDKKKSPNPTTELSRFSVGIGGIVTDLFTWFINSYFAPSLAALPLHWLLLPLMRKTTK